MSDIGTAETFVAEHAVAPQPMRQEQRGPTLDPGGAKTFEEYKEVMVRYARETAEPDFDVIGMPIVRYERPGYRRLLAWLSRERPKEEGGGYVIQFRSIGKKNADKLKKINDDYENVTKYDDVAFIESTPRERKKGAKGKRVGPRANHAEHDPLSAREDTLASWRRNRKIKHAALSFIAVTSLIGTYDIAETMGSGSSDATFSVENEIGSIVLDPLRTIRVTMQEADGGSTMAALGRTIGADGCYPFASLATNPSMDTLEADFEQERTKEYGPLQNNQFDSPFACPE